MFIIAGVEAVSSMTTAAWPPCVYNSQPHKPSGLILAQIIPANGEGEGERERENVYSRHWQPKRLAACMIRGVHYIVHCL